MLYILYIISEKEIDEMCIIVDYTYFIRVNIFVRISIVY